MPDVQDAIVRVVSKFAKVDSSKLSRDTRLADINVESIDILEIMFEIEEKYSISIPSDTTEVVTGGDGSLETLGEIVELVETLLRQQGDKSVR